MLATKAALRIEWEWDVKCYDAAGLERYTNIAAMSFTPRHFFTSWTIIFSFPPSPWSPVSGTEIGGPGASSSWTCSSVAGGTSDILDDFVADEGELESGPFNNMMGRVKQEMRSRGYWKKVECWRVRAKSLFRQSADASMIYFALTTTIWPHLIYVWSPTLIIPRYLHVVQAAAKQFQPSFSGLLGAELEPNFKKLHGRPFFYWFEAP